MKNILYGVIFTLSIIAIAGIIKFDILSNQKGYDVDGNLKIGEDLREEVILNLVEIQKHNTPSDCWGVLDEKVYDITSFFGKHPGGDKKLSQFCGRDASHIFKTAHAEKIKPMIKVQEFYKGDFVK